MTEIALDGIPLRSGIGACTVCNSAPLSDAASALSVRSHNRRISGQFKIIMCASCGGYYLQTRLAADDLTKCYGALSGATPSVPAPRSASLLKRIWHSAAPSIPLLELIDDGPVLDCGCGSGALLRELRDRGVHARGIEFSRESVELCQSLGLEVEQADLRDYVPDHGTYKFIVLSHVLEHVPDPSGLLKRLATGLMAGGAILVAVPNVNSALRWLFSSNWNDWDAPYHLTHFSNRSLANAAEKAGLKVTLSRTVGTSDELRRCLMNATDRKGRMLMLRVASQPVFRLFAGFGAGSHLLGRLSHPG